jgi:uncharacterized protein YdaU (DUF1376 family)
MNYFEFHVGDWVKATRHLTLTEEGVYLRLVLRYYEEQEPLPADLAKVQRLAGVRTGLDRRAVETVLAEFFELRADGYHHTRCDEVLQAYEKFCESQSVKGKAGAAAKWSGKSGREDGQRPASGQAAGMAEACPGDGLPTSHFQPPTTQDGSNEPSTKTARVPRVDPVGLGCELLPSPVHAAWNDWIAHRRERKHPLGATVLRKHCEFLTAFDPATQVEIINTSIRSNWQGLFAPKGAVNGRPQSRFDQTRQHLDRLIAEAEREELPLLASDDEPVRPAVGRQLRIGTG